MEDMQIECHCIVWNEAETIHLSLRHYQKFCSRIILYDNFSDDGTPDIARQMGCEVKQFGVKGVLDDREYTNLKSNCWKGSKADLVIIVDADEILMSPVKDIYVNDATIFKTYGWNVYSHDMPVHDWLDITTGFHDPNYSKLCCFNPKKIQDIGYVHGCHVAKPKGDIKYADETLILFHYRNVGGPERLVKRHALYRPRMSDWNIRWNAGSHYRDEDNKRRQDWERLYKQSKPFSRVPISGL